MRQVDDATHVSTTWIEWCYVALPEIKDRQQIIRQYD